MSEVNRAAVVGAGTMGNGIAHVLAQFGRDVQLVDVSSQVLDAALATIRSNMNRQVKKEKMTLQERDAAMDRIHASTDLAAVSGVDLVVEAATEEPDLKFRLFRDIDRAASNGAILATNTSSISITEIAAFRESIPETLRLVFRATVSHVVTNSDV